MTAPRVALVGRGRMGGAFRRSLGLRARSGRDAAEGRLPRPRGGPLLWVLAVTDAAIPAVARGLLASVRDGDAVVHLAGMLGPEVLAPLRAAGCAVASLHPLVAVAAPSDPPTLVGGAFLFEGDQGALRPVRALVRRLEGHLVVGREVERGRYHGAAALVATGAVAIAQGAAMLLRGAVEPSPDAKDVREAVASLLRSVAHNVGAVGPERALASPLMRGDTASVGRHLRAMEGAPEVQALYRAAVGVVVESLARQGAVPEEVLARARALVAGDPGRRG